MFELRQAGNDATTKLTDSKARPAYKFETPEVPGGAQKAVQVSYRNPCAKNRID